MLNNPSSNRLLSMLPEAVSQRLLPALEPVSLALGDVIYECNGHLAHVYFPTTCLISLRHTMEDGATPEVGLVGNDGMVGIALVTGGETTTHCAVVRVAGHALRMKTEVLRLGFSRGDTFQHVLLRYIQALITQISHTAVCNRLHSLEKRLCRWLLLTQDKLQSDVLTMTQEFALTMTQEFAGQMLGVRRESVAQVVHQLQSADLIRHERSRLVILDRAGLEAAVCECYWVVRQECECLLPPSPCNQSRQTASTPKPTRSYKPHGFHPSTA